MKEEIDRVDSRKRTSWKNTENHFHVRGNALGEIHLPTGVDSMRTKHSRPFSRRYFLNNKLHCIRKNFLLARLQYSSQYSLSDKRTTVSVKASAAFVCVEPVYFAYEGVEGEGEQT